MDRVGITSLLVACVVACAQGEWVFTDGDLTCRQGEATTWRLTPSVANAEVTLTSKAGNPPADGVLDLSGAIEAFDSSLSGCSLKFVEGDGLAVYAGVKDLILTNCAWLVKMVHGAATPLSAVEKVHLDVGANAMTLGDATSNTQHGTLTNGVFDGAASVCDVRILGGNVTLRNAFSGQTEVTSVVVRASGTLDLGVCSFNTGNNMRKIQRAILTAGGNLTLGERSFRHAFAKDAKVYVEAPASATVTFKEYAIYQADLNFPFDLYWNAPAPRTANDTTRTFTYRTDATWHFFNTSALVATFPQMDGVTSKQTAQTSTIWLKLPADSSDTVTAGMWRVPSRDDGLNTEEEPYRGSGDHGYGTAKWHSCSQETHGWTFADGVLSHVDGLAFTPELMGDELTLVSRAESVLPEDKVLDLTGAGEALRDAEGLPLSAMGGVRLAFREGVGATVLATTETLCIRQADWLSGMDTGSATALTSLKALEIDSLAGTLTLGTSTQTEATASLAHSVFGGAASLESVVISGGDITLNNTFNGQSLLKKAAVRARGALTVGNCAFNCGTVHGIKSLSLIAGGDFTLGYRTLRSSLATDSVVYVEVPKGARAALDNFSIYQSSASKYPINLYWNAPAPVRVKSTPVWGNSIVNWYIYASRAAEFPTMNGTDVIPLEPDTGYMYLRLPADPADTQTEGYWQMTNVKDGSTIPAPVQNATGAYGKAFWYDDSVSGAWTLSGETVSHESGWKFKAKLADGNLTLTSQACTVPASGVLDLDGLGSALRRQHPGELETGVVFSLEESEGGATLAQVRELYATNCAWLTSMPQAGAPGLTGLQKLMIGNLETDLTLGSYVNNPDSESAANVNLGVFTNSAATLQDVTVLGRKLKLNNAFNGIYSLTQAYVKASAELNTGWYSFNCGTKYNLKRVSVISGGDLTLGKRGFRQSLAAGADLYVEAPASAAVKLEIYSIYQGGVKNPINLYWNAPAPKSATAAMTNSDVTWYVFNDPALVATYPQMDGEEAKLLPGSVVSLRLPANPMDLDTEGHWFVGATDNTQSGSTGFGKAYWCEMYSDETGWIYSATRGEVAYLQNGRSLCRFAAACNGSVVTLTTLPDQGIVLADGVLDLSGVLEAIVAPDTGCSLVLAEGDGLSALAQVKELYLTNSTALATVPKQALAPLVNLEKLVVGAAERDLVFGTGMYVGASFPTGEAVVDAATNTLRDVTVIGRNVLLGNAFLGVCALTQACVKASGTLDLGACSFAAAKPCLQRVVLASGGDLALGSWSFSTAFAPQAKLYVSVPPTARVTGDTGTFHQAQNVNFYWSAPPLKANAPGTLSFANPTWYVNSAYAEAYPTMGGASVTNRLVEGYVSLSLSADPGDTRTAGMWRCDAVPDADPACADNQGTGVAYWTGRWQAEGRPIRWLSIGNSFSQQMFSSAYSLPNACAAMGIPMDAVSLVKGGCSLETHWKSNEFCSTYSVGKYFVTPDNPFAGTKNSDWCLKTVLSALDWDVITIQQASAYSNKEDSYEPWMGNLMGLIRERAPNAEVKFQQTWSYNRERSSFGGNVEGRDRMYDDLCAFIAERTAHYGLRTIPVGYAVQLYRYGLPVRYAAEEFCSADNHHMSNGQGGNYLQLMTWCMHAFGQMPTKEQIVPPDTPELFDADLARLCASNACAAASYENYGQGTVDFRYNVRFHGWDGGVYATQSVTNGASAVAPDITYPGYKLIGWSPKPTMSVTNTAGTVSSKVVHDDMDWYSVWQLGGGTLLMLH
ncbi:MAG: DUF4886 domain-containing protein [Kiritimatiellae bacterium]|nr:DUF4886 domain-containing protein [Kiritimatiellia bacterium]